MILFTILLVLFFAASFSLGFCVCRIVNDDLFSPVADDEGEDLMKPLDREAEPE